MFWCLYILLNLRSPLSVSLCHIQHTPLIIKLCLFRLQAFSRMERRVSASRSGQEGWYPILRLNLLPPLSPGYLKGLPEISSHVLFLCSSRLRCTMSTLFYSSLLYSIVLSSYFLFLFFLFLYSVYVSFYFFFFVFVFLLFSLQHFFWSSSSSSLLLSLYLTSLSSCLSSSSFSLFSSSLSSSSFSSSLF